MKIKAEIVFKVLEYAVIIICGITNLYKDEHAERKEKQPSDLGGTFRTHKTAENVSKLLRG